MTHIIGIKNPSEIIKIIDAIHDCWFDINEIQFDKDKAILSIPYKVDIKDDRLKATKKPNASYLLQIKNVKNYFLHDTEKIGCYDFNKIEYDKDKKFIHITTGVPLKLTIYIFDFEIIIKTLEE
jgi:hypothetical protein